MSDDEEGDDFEQDWYDRKSFLMEEALGEEHDMVMHAIIPYAAGGGLDLYYYPHGVPGTGIATKELSEDPEQTSSNNVFEAYELVMFTRLPLNMDDALNDETEFGRMHGNINAILNLMAPYSLEATLNPHETCEFPTEMESVGGKCLIFDGYPTYSEDESHEFGLLLLIEIFRSEMEYAQENGGAALLEKLKIAGHYPYSDLDREPVV